MQDDRQALLAFDQIVSAVLAGVAALQVDDVVDDLKGGAETLADGDQRGHDRRLGAAQSRPEPQRQSGQAARLQAAHRQIVGLARRDRPRPVPENVQPLSVVQLAHGGGVHAVHAQRFGRSERRRAFRRRVEYLRGKEIGQVAGVHGQVHAELEMRGRAAAARARPVLYVVDDQAAGVRELHQRGKRQCAVAAAVHLAGELHEQGAPALAAPLHQTAGRRHDLRSPIGGERRAVRPRLQEGEGVEQHRFDPRQPPLHGASLSYPPPSPSRSPATGCTGLPASV